MTRVAEERAAPMEQILLKMTRAAEKRVDPMQQEFSRQRCVGESQILLKMTQILVLGMAPDALAAVAAEEIVNDPCLECGKF